MPLLSLICDQIILNDNKTLHCVLDTDNRDDAAKAMEKNQEHHSIVKTKDGEFVGVVSAWDIASEVAKDSRAWPWNRTDDGRINSSPAAGAPVQALG